MNLGDSGAWPATAPPPSRHDRGRPAPARAAVSLDDVFDETDDWIDELADRLGIELSSRSGPPPRRGLVPGR